MVMLLGLLFMGSSQPLLMVLSLVFIVLCYTTYMMYSMGVYWFGYLVLLVLLSGVLVVFTYMASFCPNEYFEVVNLVIVGVFISFFLLFLEFDLVMSSDVSLENMVLWGFGVGVFNIFMVLFLLVIMVMVVWLTYQESGPYREL